MPHVHHGTRHFKLAEHPHVPGRPDIEARYKDNGVTGWGFNGTDSIYFKDGNVYGVLPLPYLGFSDIESGIGAAAKFICDFSGNKIEEVEAYRKLKEVIELKRRLREMSDCTRN